MLQSIRNNAQGIFVWIIVGLIVISFALFGLGSYLSGASKVVAASVNGTEISSTELTRAYQNYQERLRQMFGDQFRPELFGEKRMKAEVLQGLITQEVLRQMLNKQGYHASAEQILELIQKYEAFQENGQFSAARYKEVLSREGINGSEFENDLSRDIATQQIRGAITASAFLTSKEKQTLAELQNQKRKVAYFDISVQPYRQSIKINDDAIKASYEKNAHLYMTEEKVQLDYVELNMNNIAALQEVTDDMIKQHYESSPESYMASDDVAANMKITELRNKVIKGADFASLAKEYSQDKGSASQGGDLGYLTRGVGEDFDKIVFALKKGEVSPVIKSKQGFQIVKLEDIRAGDPEERRVRHILVKAESKLKPLADVKAEIKKELQMQKAGKVFFVDADKMGNLSFESPNSLEPLADALGLKIKSTDFMSRRGGTGIFANAKVLEAAFSDEVLKQARNSELLELSDTQLIVLRVKKHLPASVMPLNNVKAQIKDSLIQEQATKKVQDVASDVLQRLQNNETVESVKKRYSEITWNDTGWISRKADEKSTLPNELRQHVFTMPKPTATGKVSWDKTILASGNQAVIALYQVEQGKGETDIKSTEQFLGNADYDSLIQYLKSQADISISKASAE